MDSQEGRGFFRIEKPLQGRVCVSPLNGLRSKDGHRRLRPHHEANLLAFRDGKVTRPVQNTADPVADGFTTNMFGYEVRVCTGSFRLDTCPVGCCLSPPAVWNGTDSTVDGEGRPGMQRPRHQRITYYGREIHQGKEGARVRSRRSLLRGTSRIDRDSRAVQLDTSGRWCRSRRRAQGRGLLSILSHATKQRTASSFRDSFSTLPISRLVGDAPRDVNPMQLLALDLKAGLKDADPDRVLDSISMLGNMRHLGSTRELKRLSQNPDLLIRTYAWQALMRLHDYSVLPSVVEFFQTQPEAAMRIKLRKEVSSDRKGKVTNLSPTT